MFILTSTSPLPENTHQHIPLPPSHCPVFLLITYLSGVQLVLPAGILATSAGLISCMQP